MVTIELLRHGREMGARLAEDLAEAHRLYMAVASADASALSVLDLDGWAREGRELWVLAGAEGYGTDLDLLRHLEGLPGARCRVYHPLDGTFHPAMFVLEKARSRVAYVGSSALSLGGLSANVEVNVRLEGSPGDRELERAMSLFEELFWSELSMPLSAAFEAEYRALAIERRSSLSRHPGPLAEARLRFLEATSVAEHRVREASRLHLLVVSRKNYEYCMRTRSFGQRRPGEIEKYGRGDLFFFHVIGRGRGLKAMGMFLGETFREEGALPSEDVPGPFRRRFAVIGELSREIRTRPILEALRPGAAKHWFGGFVQASHSLSVEDFRALEGAFLGKMREELGLDNAPALAAAP
jgi:HKD family nuclease